MRTAGWFGKDDAILASWCGSTGVPSVSRCSGARREPSFGCAPRYRRQLWTDPARGTGFLADGRQLPTEAILCTKLASLAEIGWGVLPEVGRASCMHLPFGRSRPQGPKQRPITIGKSTARGAVGQTAKRDCDWLRIATHDQANRAFGSLIPLRRGWAPPQSPAAAVDRRRRAPEWGPLLDNDLDQAVTCSGSDSSRRTCSAASVFGPYLLSHRHSCMPMAAELVQSWRALYDCAQPTGCGLRVIGLWPSEICNGKQVYLNVLARHGCPRAGRKRREALTLRLRRSRALCPLHSSFHQRSVAVR